jgi:hypothetical protein
MSDDVKEHGERVNGTRGAERCEHVFRKTVDVVCLPVVGVEEDLNMLTRSLYCVGVCASVWIHKVDSVIDCVVRVALV